MYVLGGFLITPTHSIAQTNSLNSWNYTMNLLIFQDDLYQYSEAGKYIYSKNGGSVTLHFFTEDYFDVNYSWDTTIIMSPNSIIPIYYYEWYDLNDSLRNIMSSNTSYINISSNEPLFVFGSKYEGIMQGLIFESCTQIPDAYLGNRFVVPGVYQSTPADFFIYPIEETVPITVTPTTNANDSLNTDSSYIVEVSFGSYGVVNDFSNSPYNYILDTLFPNSLSGSTVVVDNCKKIKVDGNLNYVFSFPYQFQADLLVNQLYHNQIQVIDTSDFNLNYWRMLANTVSEDLFPINTMGSKYICSPPPGGFEIATFTAPYNNTMISINGVAWDTLNARECRVKLFKETAFIESSQPISMVVSHSFMRDSTGWFWGGGGMIQVPALEQTATSGWFFYPSLKFLNNDYVVDTYNLSNYFAQEKSTIVVVTHTAGVNQTILNNINIGSMLQPVAGNPQYSSARINITTGFNEISNPNGLIVWSTSYQTASDSIIPFGNYICYGAPLVMSFNKPTYEGKINTTPIENTLIDPYTICVGTPLQYTVVTNADSNLLNTWEFGDGGLTVGDTVFYTYADTGYYHVNLFVNSYCDTIKGLVHVVAPPVIALGNDTTICPESSLLLDASVSGNATYMWSTGSTSPEITLGDTGTYHVTATTDVGCLVSGTIHISMYPTVNVNLGNDTVLCYLAHILLDATQPYEAHANYVWQDQSTNSVFTVINQGQYWVVVTNLCTQKSDTINIDNLMNPTLYLGNDTTICMNHPLLLNATIPWGINYRWENGSTNATRLVEYEGTYWVEASNPCVSVSDTIFIKVDDCDPILVIPNVFTPNNDGFNDLFIADVTKNITSINLLIFNRWGENIFQSNNLNFAWDGQFKNQKCPEGVYFWVIQYVDINGNTHDLTGTVTLLR